MRFKVPFVLTLLLAMAGLVAAGPAQASDAQLRSMVKQQEKKVKSVLEDFEKTSDDIESKKDFQKVAEAAGEVRDAIQGYRKALAPVSGSTANGKKGKTKLRAALKQLDLAFAELQEFFAQGDDATKAELEASEKKFERKADKGEKLEDEALKLLGIESDD